MRGGVDTFVEFASSLGRTIFYEDVKLLSTTTGRIIKCLNVVENYR